ncbi:MAG: hypothetical protein A2X35_06245 [Elusimicrobia bacterium GWA2_61_42]|nr:MAG: hypothetical protein A2X35_06245 [Elusimicrobia bacterium GWA2_61_42]OGR78753.1 MAG: hypothetical protein A2X38_04190 [Elusimicrobia bacterium GWC2_61_25]
MRDLKPIILSAAFALAAASVSFAGPVAYQEAAAPWSAAQAVRLAPALTPEVLKAFEAEAGQAAAAGLQVKKEKVSGLLKRFSACALNAQDVKTADKYLDKKFRAEVRYFAGQGCADFKEAAAGLAAGPQAASLDALEGFSASGALSSAAGSARFFDGSAAQGRPAVTPGAPGSGARTSVPALSAPAALKPLSSNVPALRSAAVPAPAQAVRPPEIGKDGRVNQALVYWNAMRKESWNALKKDDLTPAQKAKLLGKLTAGAGLGGLLYISNLSNVEIAGARLRWDVKNGSGAGVITADAAKLAFHSLVFALVLLPVPLTKVYTALKAGQPWAIALVGAMAAGPVDRYILHLAD